MTSLEALLQMRISCVECRTSESTYWRRTDSGDTICDTCYNQRLEVPPSRTSRSQALLSLATALVSREITNVTPRPSDSIASAARSGTSGSGVTRKSSRLKPSGRSKQSQNAAKPSATKGRGRRLIFKKNPSKAHTAVATIVSSDYVFYEGSYWQIGDVVSVTDVDDGLTYFAQLRGFLEDQFCSKTAVITWLIPKPGINSDEQKLKAPFDPSSYTAGPEEDLPRDMAHFEFVCHAPTDYFCHGFRSCAANGPPIGCIWTSFGPEIQEMESHSLADNPPEFEPNVRQTKADADRTKNEKETVKKQLAPVRDKSRSHKASVSRSKDNKK